MARKKTPGPGPERVPKKPEQGPKVKRLSLYPQNREPFTTEYTKEHPSGRYVPSKRKPEMKEPQQSPEQAQQTTNQILQQPVQQAPVQQIPQQAPVQPAQPPGDDMGMIITGVIVIFVIVFAVIMMDDGGGGNGCSTTCSGYRGTYITVAAGCDCPSGSSYYNTITGSTCHGCKQCYCG